jgi:hypothetical protein
MRGHKLSLLDKGRYFGNFFQIYEKPRGKTLKEHINTSSTQVQRHYRRWEVEEEAISGQSIRNVI